MQTPQTQIIGKSTYTDLETILTSLCSAQFFFENKECKDIELHCPVYLDGDFLRRHEKALRNIVLLAHIENVAVFSTVSNLHNPSFKKDRAEYLVYRALQELQQREENNK